MYDTVKGSDWLGDQDAIHYMTREVIAPYRLHSSMRPLILFKSHMKLTAIICDWQSNTCEFVESGEL